MKMRILLKKLHIENKEFITSEEMKAYCRSMKMDYATVIRYFIARGYLTRIFRGIFYVKSIEEQKLGRSKYSHLELVAKGLDPRMLFSRRACSLIFFMGRSTSMRRLG